MGNILVFGILAVIAVISAIMMLRSHSAVYSALWLVLNFATIGVLYIVLNAPFIAMVQITVYAGAIMVLFLFVIMLLGAERLPAMEGGQTGHKILALVLGAALLVTFAVVMISGSATAGTAVAGTFDTSPQALGLLLFEDYVFPFELTGILLLVSMIGVVILNTRKKRGTSGNN
jgi:NADH-quinone oxidoreductase subunit J